MFFLTILITSTWLLKKKYGVRINLHPSFFIPLLTIGIIMIPLIFILVSDGMPYENIGVEFIAFSMLCFQLGSLVFIEQTMRVELLNSRKTFMDIYSIRKIQKGIVITTFFSLVFTLSDMVSYYGLTFNLQSVLSLPALNAATRYSGEDVQVISKAVFFLSMSEYIAMIFGGILLASKKRSFIILILLIGIFRAFISGARAGFLFGIFMFLASFIVANISLHPHSSNLFTWSNIRRLLLVGFTFVLFFLVVQMSRGGVFELDRIYGILIYLNKWFFAYLPSFSFWLSNYDFTHFTMGQYTFAGLFDALNIAERKQGLYDPVDVGILTNTNIFTVYRGLLLDFNVGCFLVLFLLGSFSSWAFHNFMIKGNVIYYIILFSVYVFFFWSHTVSIFNYNVIILSVIIAAVLISLGRYKFIIKLKND
jgi:oligosaccharide repeat unit polymerase